jgi:hypothetical protein
VAETAARVASVDAGILDVAEEVITAVVDVRTDSVEKSIGASRDPKDDCAPSMSGSAPRKKNTLSACCD